MEPINGVCVILSERKINLPVVKEFKFRSIFQKMCSATVLTKQIT